MGALMVCCPATGRAVSLGVELDPVTFDRAPDFVASFHCASCGVDHPWSKADAWIGAAEFTPSAARTKAGAKVSAKAGASVPPRTPPLRGGTSGRRVPAEWGMPLAA
jgi:hypothetical protein